MQKKGGRGPPKANPMYNAGGDGRDILNKG